MKTKILLKAFVSVLIAVILCSCDNADEKDKVVSIVEQSSFVSTADFQTSSKEESNWEPVFTEDCEAVIERFAVSDENVFIKKPVEYAVDKENYTLSIDIDYDHYVDLYTLTHCKAEISVEGGDFWIDDSALNSDGSIDLTALSEIIVIDNAGLMQKYTVITNRTVYDIPIVNIYLQDFMDKSKISRTDYSEMMFFIDAENTEEFHSTPVLTGKIRGRGNSTWKWAKKPYRIKLDEAAQILNLDRDKDWVLLSNYCDKSLLRNTVAFEMSRSLDGMDWNPTQYPVDLFINGEYCGVYAIGEKLEISKERVNIEKDSTDADTGFLIEVGGSEKGEVLGKDFFHTKRELANFISYKEPDPDTITDEQRAFIKDYMDKAEDAIVSGKGYEEYIDVKSFCDWIIIHELTYNADCSFRRSCYINKDKGGKLKMGPVWDFDLAFGNCDADNQYYNDWVTVGYNGGYVSTNWCNYLMENEAFRSKLKERWNEVRDDLVKTALDSIDFYSKKLERSQAENFNRWKIWGIRVGFQSKRNFKYESYEEQVQYLRDFINMRAKWIDENI